MLVQKNQKKILFGMIFLLFLSPYSSFPDTELKTSNCKYSTNITRAVNYLLEQYNPELELIFESEDSGTHWLKQVNYPDFRWGYNQTYWLYSDNLIAAYALEPWAPEISAKIKKSIYSYKIPKSNKFEALIGEDIGIDRGANNIIVIKNINYVILIRRHDGMLPDPRYKFVDNMIYKALSSFYQGRIEESQNKILEVYKMWNGTCIVDSGVTQKKLWPNSAPSDIGFGQNFKIALLLYGAKVTGTYLPEYYKLEEILWSKQQENGGITTLSTPQGKPIGSANTETTAMTLLIYNEQLISNLQNVPKNLESDLKYFEKSSILNDKFSFQTRMISIENILLGKIIISICILTFIIFYLKKRNGHKLIV